MRKAVNRPTENFALIKRTDKPLSNIAFFLHGFRGNYLTTWGNLAEQLEWEADKNQVFDDWDYAFIGYDTKAVQTYLDIAHFVWTEWMKASDGHPPYGRKYSRLAMFGHSLGTLGIRQALCASSRRPDSMLHALNSVTFFGTPINGSPWAGAASMVYKIGAALEPNSPQLRMLKTWTSSAYRSEKWPEVKLILGLDDKVVGYTNSEFVEWDGDKSIPFMTGFDHSDLVKPNGWNTAVIDYIKAGLS